MPKLPKTPEIPEDLCTWLKGSRFVNYCFVSYPRVDPRIDDDLHDFVSRMRDRLTAELEHAGAENLVHRNADDKLPEIFMDDGIPPGVEWPDDLRRNLGGSVCMLAILTPSYFRRTHEWCGKEWSAMSQLETARLRNTTMRLIIPVHYRQTTIPVVAGHPQAIDLSSLTTSSRDYYKEPEFKNAILDICHQIIQIAGELRKNNAGADLDGFVFPLHSQFIVAGSAVTQAPPLRTA